MPYLQTPAGNSILVPDGMSYETALEKARLRFPQEFGIKPQEGFGANVKKAGRDFLEQWTGGVAEGASPGAGRAALQRNADDQSVKSTNWEDVKKAYGDRGLFGDAQGPGGISSLGAFARDTAAQSLPQMGATLGGARLGAMVGAATPIPFGALIGGGVGAAIASVPAFAGQNMQTQLAEQQKQGVAQPLNRGAAWGAAVPQAAFDVGSSFFMLGKLGFGKAIGKSAEEMMAKSAAQMEREAVAAAQRSLAGAAGQGALKGVAVEMPTEIAQQVLGRYQAGQELFSPDALKEYEGVAAGAGILGGAFGTVGGVHGRGSARTQIETRDRAATAKAAKDALDAENARKQTPEYLQELTQQYDTLKEQRDTLSQQIKDLRASKKGATKEEARGIDTQLKDLSTQLSTARKLFDPVAKDYGERAEDVAKIREQQRVAGLDPMEALVGEQAPAGTPAAADTSFVDMAQGQQRPGQPQAQGPNYLHDFIRSIEDPNAAAVGVSTLQPQEVVQALLTRPDLAKRMLSSGERFPGAKSTSESNLWKKELAKQFKAALAAPPQPQDSTQPINQMIADREQMGQEQLAEEMGTGREKLAAQRAAAEAAQQKSLAAQAALEPKIAEMQEKAKTPDAIAQKVDAGVLTPMLSKRLGIEHPGQGPFNLRDQREAATAAPAINAALQNVLELRQKITENKTDANTSKLPKLEMQVNELKRLQLHLNDTLGSQATDAFIEGQLQAASPKRTPGVNLGLEPGLQPQQYGERARALGTNHEAITGELYSQLDELLHGNFFQDPNSGTPLNKRPGEIKGAMQMEQTLVRKAKEARQALVQNMLKEAAAKREAQGLDGLTHAEAAKAALDVRSAIDALIDKSRSVDDSATSLVHDPSKDKVIRDAFGHVHVIKGGRNVSEQQARAKNDLAYAAVYETGNFTEAAQAANTIIDKARAALAVPPSKPRGKPQKGPFALAPQSEAINQAMEQQVAGAKLPAGEVRDNRRIQTTLDRIRQAQQRPKGTGMADARELGMTRALLEKARQFLLGAPEVTMRDEKGAAIESRLAASRVGTEMLDNIDQTIERFQKGIAADPETARDIIDRISAIEREGQDQRHQMDMFGEGKVFETANPEQMQRFITERQRQTPVAEQKAAAQAAEKRLGYVPTGLAAQARIARLDANIEQARAKVARLESVVRTKSDSAQLGHVRKLLNELEGKATLAAAEVRGGRVPRSLSEAFAQLAEVNAASEQMRVALARAGMQAKATEQAAVPGEKRAPEAAKEPMLTEQPKETAPGTAVVRSKVEEVPIVATRGKKKYELNRTSYDEEGNYIAPPQRQAVERTTMQTEVERKLAERERLRAEARERMEDRQRQKAQMQKDLEHGVAQEMTKEERAAMHREAMAAAASRKGEAIRKNLPKMGKGAPEPALRASKQETSGVEDPGAPPAAKMPKREAQSAGEQVGAPTAHADTVRQQEALDKVQVVVNAVIKAELAAEAARSNAAAIETRSGGSKMGQAVSDRQIRDAEQALDSAHAVLNGKLHALVNERDRRGVAALVRQQVNDALGEKKKASHTSTPATGSSTVAALNAEIAAEFGDTTGKVTVVPTRADMPVPGRAVTIDGNHVYIAADEVGPGQARGLVLHELGVHVGMDEDTVAKAHAALEDMVRNGEEHADLAAKALAIQKASESTDTRDEAVAHFVELASNAGIKPTEGAAKFFKPLMDWAKKVLSKFGLASDKLSAQDIVDMARGAAAKALQETKQKAGEVKYSSTPKYAADYDKRSKDIQDRLISNGTPLLQRMKEFVRGFRMNILDNYDMNVKFASMMEDQTAASQMMYDLRMHEMAGHATKEVITNGPIQIHEYKNAAGRLRRMVKSSKGPNLIDAAKELANTGVGDFNAADRAVKTYLIAERAEIDGYDKVADFLPEGTKDKPRVTEAELKYLLDQGRANPAFQKIRAINKSYSEGLIDFVVQTGAMSPLKAADLKAGGNYVSFYRKDGDIVSLMINNERVYTVGNISSQPYLKSLVGSNMPITGFLEGALQNTRLLTEMALSNLATKSTAETMNKVYYLDENGKQQPAAVVHNGTGGKGNNILRYKAKGEDKFAVINTEAFGISPEMFTIGMSGVATQITTPHRLLSAPASMLRKFIVRNPLYGARILVRDSISNAVVAGVDGVPVASQAKEIIKMLAGKSKTEKMLQERLLTGGQTISGTTEDQAMVLKQLASGKAGWHTAMSWLDAGASKADAASRITAYNSAIANGLDDMDATMAALETMNYTRHGAMPWVRHANSLIPFFNAQLQGLDVMYRSLTGKMPFNEQLKIRQKLITRGGMLFASSLAYAAMMQGDDDYENASMQERFSNWFVSTPWGTMRVPIPFEAGFLFKALPEALAASMQKDNESAAVLAGLAQVFSATTTPGFIPQGAKPLIEQALNREFFTGRDIEDTRMQGVQIAERYGDKTKEVSKALSVSFDIAGREIGVSPARIEHLVRAYTGALGIAALGLVDGLMSTASAKPTLKPNERPIVGPLFVEEDAAGMINRAYTMIEQYGRAKATYDKMVGEGREDDAERFADKFADQIAKADTANSVKSQLGKLTKREGQIRSSDWTGDEKREALDEVRKEKIEISRMALEALRD